MTSPYPALGIIACIALGFLWWAIKRARQSIDNPCSDFSEPDRACGHCFPGCTCHGDLPPLRGVPFQHGRSGGGGARHDGEDF